MRVRLAHAGVGSGVPWYVACLPISSFGSCPAFRLLVDSSAVFLTALFFRSMDQQGSSVLPAKASKVQLKPAMVP